jgi:hypothetical protein
MGVIDVNTDYSFTSLFTLSSCHYPLYHLFLHSHLSPPTTTSTTTVYSLQLSYIHLLDAGQNNRFTIPVRISQFHGFEAITVHFFSVLIYFFHWPTATSSTSSVTLQVFSTLSSLQFSLFTSLYVLLHFKICFCFYRLHFYYSMFFPPPCHASHHHSSYGLID